jgi:hypothetical protein
MYSIQIGEFAVQCNTADEVRALCDGSTHGISPIAREHIPGSEYQLLAKPARRKYRTKNTDQRGAKMSERWAKARRYAKRHDVTPTEAFKMISK